MEIHSPEAPIRSWKDVAVHLAIVSVGILIALGLETLVEEYRHHRLVEEARARISAELRSNQKQVAEYVGSAREVEASVGGLSPMISDVRAGRLAAPQYHFRLPRLRLVNAAWTTAATSGALTLIEYAEVQRLADIYTLQSQLEHRNEEFIDAFSVAMPRSDPKRWSDPYFETWQDRAGLAYSRAKAEEATATRLLDAYKVALESPR